MTPHISIIGAGSRGTSLAQVVADKGHQVLLWSLDAKDIALINQCHINPSYIKEVQLPDSIVATDSLSDALQRAEYVIFAVPSCAFVPVLTQLQPYYTGQKIIIATKGFFPSKDFLFSSQLQQQLPSASFAFLYGPSHAEEVIQRMPTWVTVASAERSYANELSFLFQTDYFHCEISTDIVGIQIIAGLKNVIALLCGMSDGLGAGVNQKSVIVTKGIQEI
jgi:glycerol-3-phosphate dehydrogenase (NAD(P)+)